MRRKQHHPSRDQQGSSRPLVDRRTLLKSAALLAGAASASCGASTQAQAPNQSQTTLIRGGRIISMDPTVGDLDNGDVLIEGGAIKAVGRNLSAPNAQIVDASSKLVLPGFIDGHRHAWMTQFRALLSPPPWGDVIVANLQHKHYRPEDAYAGALLGGVESVNAGITTMFEFGHAMTTDEFADGMVRGLQESTVRGVFGYGLPHFPVKPDAIEGARRAHKRLFSSVSPNQLVTFAMACRAGNAGEVTTWGPEVGNPWENLLHDLRLGRELAAKRIHFHAVSIKPLYDAKLLGPDLCFVHPRRPGLESAEDFKMVADSGGTFVVCPGTGQDNYPIQEFLRLGIPVGLGLDDGPGIRTDLFLTMRAVIRQDRAFERQLGKKERKEPDLITYREVLKAATIDGARAVGLEDKVGSLTPGKRADIILLDLDNLNYPRDKDPLPSVLAGADTGSVSWVFIDGVVRKRDGKLVGVDVKRARDAAQRSYDYLVQKGGLQNT
jgi:cytosine/adenosine deaminase-related metal-dependent hydrolase